MQHAQRSGGVLPRVVADENDVDGVGCRGDEGKHVAAIEMRDAGGGNREVVETEAGGKRSGVNPTGEAMPPE